MTSRSPTSLLDRLDALGRSEQADRGDILRPAVDEELDRRRERPTGGEHRVDREALPVAEVIGQALGVGRRLERGLVADHAEEAHLCGRQQLDQPLQHPEPGTQNGHDDRRGSEIFTPMVVVTGVVISTGATLTLRVAS